MTWSEADIAREERTRLAREEDRWAFCHMCGEDWIECMCCRRCGEDQCVCGQEDE